MNVYYIPVVGVLVAINRHRAASLSHRLAVEAYSTDQTEENFVAAWLAFHAVVAAFQGTLDALIASAMFVGVAQLAVTVWRAVR